MFFFPIGRLFESPLPQDDHAERAVKCALHMVKRLEELQEKWKSEGKEPLYAGFGINTGDVIVGNIYLVLIRDLKAEIWTFN